MLKSPTIARCCRHRRVEPGRSYLITRKTRDDLLLIRPSYAVNQILLYTLLRMAQRYGVKIHGYCFMSNHLHLVITDVRACLPAFMRDLLTVSSKALKALLKERLPIWSRKRYSDVKLLDMDAAERKVVYTIVNPSRAGLTKPKDWPGLNSGKHRFGDTITARRPDFFFSSRYQPDEVSAVLEPLCQVFFLLTPDTEAAAKEESVARIQALVQTEIEAIQAELESKGRMFAGADRVLHTSRRKRGSQPVRTISPRFATRNRELLRAAIADERWFETEHERARQRFVGGQHGAIFPPGTYGYRQLLGVRVAKRGATA